MKSYFDCPVCGADLQASTSKHRTMTSVARKRMNTHLRNSHVFLLEEPKLRSDLATLSSQHPHRTPRRERPIRNNFNGGIHPTPPLRPPTEEEKRTGDTPRLRAYMENSGVVSFKPKKQPSPSPP